MADNLHHNDSYSPEEIVRRVEQVGIKKANLSFGKMAMLATLAGAFISMGGMCFTLGLLLCVVAGADLFTGNSLLTIAVAQKKTNIWQMLKNWAVVWSFNLVGSLVIAAILYYGQHYSGGSNAVGVRVLASGASKAALAPGVIFLRGIMANFLVCLAAWMAYGGRTITDKLCGMLLPVTAFVAAGFEHSVANMFFIPYAMLVKGQAAVAAMPGVPVEKLKYLTPGYFVQNLVFSTLGNIVGGAVMVGLAYWYIYIRSDSDVKAKSRVA